MPYQEKHFTQSGKFRFTGLHFTYFCINQPIATMIRIFATGGTFDKEYNMLTGELFFKDTHLDELLQKGRCMAPTNIQTVMMIDSLEMNDTHRTTIALHCNSCTEDKIIITHGTDTMTHTAEFLAEKVKNKTVVLTGAMIPIKFGSSDGLFNLGCAIAFVQALPSGVYVAMNGRVFTAGNVRKNKETGSFEDISRH